MGKRKNILWVCAIGICLSLIFSINLFAYEKRTHVRITKEAIESVKSKINNVVTDEWKLKSSERFKIQFSELQEDGNTIVKRFEGTYSDLITSGGWSEDIPSRNCRFHFYDPTTGGGLFGLTSAMVRGTDDKYSIAKIYLYNALTADTKLKRSVNFGLMFHSLGRSMHLLEDMAVPAHVRNDQHIPGDPYETWAEQNVAILPTGSYEAVSFSNDDVKYLWDEKRSPQNPGADIGIGLAEFTNFNFLSKDTNLDDKLNAYLYPKNNIYPDRWEEIYTFEDKKGNTHSPTIKYTRSIIKDAYKPAQSVDPFNYLTAYSYWNFESKKKTGKEVYSLNNKCHAEYSQYLIPRSVGYSAGLLNHFFRGKLEITKKEAKRESADNRSYDITLKIKNDSGEGMSGGSFVLMYKKSETEYAQLGNTKSLSELLETGVTELPNGAETKEWVINDAIIEMPEYAKDEFKQDDFSKIEFTLAYSGGLGQESSVTIGKVFDEMEEIPPYYFHVQLSPEYVETGSPVLQTETFTIKVQCYNYGTSETKPEVEGERYVDKKEGTESWWHYVNVGESIDEWRKEKINPNCIAPEEWEKNDYTGEVSFGINTSGYELYVGGEKLETLELVDGTGSISGVVIKAEDGNIGDNHLFLIISASDGTGNGNNALMVNPIVISPSLIESRYRTHDIYYDGTPESITWGQAGGWGPGSFIFSDDNPEIYSHTSLQAYRLLFSYDIGNQIPIEGLKIVAAKFRSNASYNWNNESWHHWGSWSTSSNSPMYTIDFHVSPSSAIGNFGLNGNVGAKLASLHWYGGGSSSWVQPQKTIAEINNLSKIQETYDNKTPLYTQLKYGNESQVETSQFYKERIIDGKYYQRKMHGLQSFQSYSLLIIVE
ncbi:MAG: hypothetical protein Q7J67_07910 [bacterium]|nr:hypothetical protein [bacterium]